ncbi:dihydropteroate synthase [Colwellia sp. E2M01]|uniref:dihydropteroate synthase n=1 Tax=Colwellia sp. E2M01 TaxID=2841561 RepID=UPI001C085280|nr:dihydropteroate synthase [Colwellia sp. E2M01]MBU2871758.1 dihydropteroate synthase [Colwellia sp. E2M01]
MALTNKYFSSLTQPLVMGILNITPDSFSDGGKFASFDNALKQVQKMIDDGVDIIDIGGESTRPGAVEVSEADELARVIPLLKAIKTNYDIKVSIDTSKAAVMAQSIEQGADIINDVRALQNEGCLNVLANSDVPVCLMHMQGLPRTMQNNPQYSDLIGDIKQFFIERIEACEQAGINQNRIILDPGFGFGKTLEQNYQLLAQLHKFDDLGLSILSGTSRKSMIGNLLERKVDERLAGSLTTAIIAAQQQAKIIRVHDVKETVDALKVLAITQKYQY